MSFSQSTHLLICFFGGFNVHHKDWLTSSGCTDLYSGELCSNNLTRMVNFPIGIPVCDSHGPALLDLFLLLLVFVLQWLPFYWEILIMDCVSFHWLSVKLKMGCPISWYTLWLFSCWLGCSLWSFEKCSLGGYLWTHCFCFL